MASMDVMVQGTTEKKEALSAINRKLVFFAGIFLGLHCMLFLGVSIHP